ncbi:hypothetical protein Pse7429DRAFT_2087 [Pseudanabaena biceps PCC 7429]|uniref:Uncharacterized protein n=1 Tax=Pseudanabaena biceps PCC 7429 TaxID=927668 RepID=L8N2Y2_9CYAN|nr:hypothetical protein Pse7429DRAFT_2087 [Pseudanabaena biceps PCC 7429]
MAVPQEADPVVVVPYYSCRQVLPSVKPQELNGGALRRHSILGVLVAMLHIFLKVRARHLASAE